MTQNSFDNYKEYVEYGILSNANKLTNIYQGGGSYIYRETVFGLLIIYYELLNNYTLVTEETEEEDYVDNFLTPTEMRTISEFVNRILGINYVIDFLLGDDEWGSIPAFSFPGTNESEIAVTPQTIL